MILEVDLEYLKELHEMHNDYPLAAEKMKVTKEILSPYCINIQEQFGISIGQVVKLISTLSSKKNYVLRYRNLLLYLSLGVVSKIVIPARTSDISEKTLKIPDYARDYRNEYLFIRGINKTCEKFVKLIKENEEFYYCSKAFRTIRKIKKLKRLGYFKNISRIKFEIDDVENIEFIHSAIEEYKDLYCDPYTGVFYEELYNIEAEVDNPGFKNVFINILVDFMMNYYQMNTTINVLVF